MLFNVNAHVANYLRSPLVPQQPIELLSSFASLVIKNNRASREPPLKPSQPVFFEPLVSQSPPLFALVIGINKYKTSPELEGAVPDTNAVQKYLEQNLGVPTSHIRNLRDARATRTAIIQEFRNLQADPRIQRDDPILIFYAGHGGETPPPKGWETGGPSMQMIIPHDFGIKSANRTVHGIPDRTIAALLDRLAAKKGDNITVIFDCCHSASSTRSGIRLDSSRRPRRIFIPNNIPADLDSDIWGAPNTMTAPITMTRAPVTMKGGTFTPQGFLQSGLRSHVLLSACSSLELAHEEKGRGAFTKAFLETIIAVGVDKVTYSDLLHRLPILPDQNPQCEGINQNRIFFNTKARSPGQPLYAVYLNGSGYTVDAGAAHGITEGAEFTIYKERDSPPNTSPLGALVVLEMNAFTAQLGLASGISAFPLPQTAFALQTKTGIEADLRLHVATDEKLISVLGALAKEIRGTRGFLLVEKDMAELDMAVEDGSVVFESLNTLVAQFGSTRMPFRVNPEVGELYPVICAAQRYHWNLRRTNPKHNLQKKVRLEFTKLKRHEEEREGEFHSVIQPEGNDLNVDGVVDVFVDPDSMYGIKIINESSVPLYSYVFFFDSSDLSITSYYQPGTAGSFKVDPPLMPNQSLTIGYGGGGAPPFSYSLAEGQEVNVGFLKLFLTTEHIVSSDVPQSSPFETPIQGVPYSYSPPPIKHISTWDTILVTVVQRKPPGQHTLEIPIGIGSFNTQEARPLDRPMANTSKRITFGNPFIAPPSLPLGLNCLDVDCNANVRVSAHAGDIQEEGFNINIDSWGDTTLYAGGASWLEISPNLLEYQCGQFSTMEDLPWYDPHGTSRRITFERPFDKPPKVISFFNQLDIAKDRNWRVITTATDIDTTGFTIHINAWWDTVMCSATAGWIAYPQDSEEMFGGTASTRDLRPWYPPQRENCQKINFGGITLRNKPNVFMAINSIDIGCEANLRLKVYADDITTTGMTWHIASWADTVLYSAGISYLCVA